MRHVSHWSGEGKSKKLAELGAALYRSLGQNAYVIDPSDWAHGDKSALPDEWVLVSESGESPALQAIAKAATCDVTLITGSWDVSKTGDWPSHISYVVPLPMDVPTFPITEVPLPWIARVTAQFWPDLRQYISERGVSDEDFLRGHPGGAIGKKRTMN